jgi:nicotinate-nucleotide pyrophosphorylase (carboxylating)
MSLLTLERPVLNVLSYLSGIATQTRTCVQSLVDTTCRVFDTRKTVPGWRGLAKYAVRCGGGFCHRIGLYDAVLVKDNHLEGTQPGELTQLLNEKLAGARKAAPLKFVEVEVDSIEQLKHVLQCDAGLIDVILLDNMSIQDCTTAVQLRNETAPNVALEASGGLSLDTLRAVADTGVDRVAIGRLTHSVTALDLAMEIGDRN